MTTQTAGLKGAALIDFTGTVSDYRHMRKCCDEFRDLVRSGLAPPAVVVIDRAVAFKHDSPVVVRDHLNFTGTSPLLGPNHPAGERFPVVQGIYIDDVLPELPKVVVAGLKPELKPSAEDVKLMESFGAQAACYNVVPAMLLTAHARRRMLAILLPEGQSLPEAIFRQIQSLTGSKQ